MAFWKPGEAAPSKRGASSVSLPSFSRAGSAPSRSSGPVASGPSHVQQQEQQRGTDKSVVYNPFKQYSVSQQRARLPIFQYREKILYLLEHYSTLVLVGETGSGKSTQIPQYLHEAGWTADGRVVACLQPRRVAAVSVATRVAEEMGCRLGEEVGYTIRFEDVTDEGKTAIKYMTEGTLIREMMRDPLLTRYSVIILDEAHERTMFMDIVVGLLQKIQRKRPDMKIIVSSATLDAETFRDFFNHNHTQNPAADTATILSVEGRTYPVNVFYSEAPVPDYVKATVDTIVSIHQRKKEGDVLAFLTSQDEIDNAVRLVRERLASSKSVVVLPMYGSLPAREQLKVLEPLRHDGRKIIISTNIAEASVTIDGIVYVIDCGFVKLKGYDPDSGVESLVVAPISKASAQQRAGRAGRVRSGAVYRLYTEEGFHSLDDATLPEMQRSEISSVILQLKALGIDNVLRFPFLSPPSPQAMQNALEVLYALDGLDDSCALTEPTGLNMAEFPLPPMQAKMLLTSGSFGCTEEIMTIVAMLQVQHVFVTPPNKKKESAIKKLHFTSTEGDILTYLNVYDAFERNGKNPGWCGSYFLNYKSLVRASEIRKQLRRTLKRFGVPIVDSEGDTDAILRCVVSGLFANAARLHMDGTYRTLRGTTQLAIHPSSVLYSEKPPKYVVFNEVLLTGEVFMRDITAVEPEWFSELAPKFYTYQSKVDANPKTEKRAKIGDVLSAASAF
eukprot:m.32573 g.32573  ORF g.32573 m.32573 type:complete len:729 (+) comp9527_c1_seq2:195-2381(+)